MQHIECPACGKEKLHTVYCGIWKETICQAHCKGCPYLDDGTSLSHCQSGSHCLWGHPHKLKFTVVES